MNTGERIEVSGIDCTTDRGLVDHMKGQLRQAGVAENAALFDKLNADIVNKNPLIGPYLWLTTMVKRIPEKVSDETQKEALKFLTSSDPNASALGRNAFVLLNLKTVRTLVIRYRDLVEKEDLDDLASEGLSGLLSLRDDLQIDRSVIRQVYDKVNTSLIDYISQQTGVPSSIVRNTDCRLIIETVDSIFGQDNGAITQNGIDETVNDLVAETGVIESTLRLFIEQKMTLIESDGLDPEEVAEEGSSAERLYLARALRESMGEALQTLSPRTREIMEDRFGWREPSGMTLEAIGKKLKLTRSRISQIEAKALSRLRHPARSKHLKPYYEQYCEPDTSNIRFKEDRPGFGEILPVGSIVLEEAFESNRRMEDNLLGIEHWGFDEATRTALYSAGIDVIGDFFGVPPNRFFNQDNPRLLEAARTLLKGRMAILYREAIKELYPKGTDLPVLENIVLKALNYRDSMYGFLNDLQLNLSTDEWINLEQTRKNGRKSRWQSYSQTRLFQKILVKLYGNLDAYLKEL